MQKSSRLSLSQVAQVLKAASYDCPFDGAVDVMAVVSYEEQYRTVTIRSEISVAIAVLEAYGHWQIDSVFAVDTSHSQTVLKIGTVAVQDMDMFPVLISLQTLVGNIPYEPCEDAEDMDMDMEDDGPTESTFVKKTLSELLEEKFGPVTH